MTKVFAAYAGMVLASVVLMGLFMWVISVATCYRQSAEKQSAFDWNMVEGCVLK